MEKIQYLKQQYGKVIYQYYFPDWVENKNIPCFNHTPDKNPSFSIYKKNGEYKHKCHACGITGDVLDIVKQHECLTDTKEVIRRLKEIAGVSSAVKKEIDRVYDYKDAAGNIVSQTVRYRPKDFSQRRPDGKGGWIWGIKDIKLVPYNLQEVLKSQYAFIVEGEKDVESLRELGIVASCNPMGAGKWKAEYNEYFKSKKIMVIEDNDNPGRDHALQVAKSLHGIATSIKVIALSDIPEKGDITDWIEARKVTGRTIEEIKAELKEIVKAAPEWIPAKDEPEEQKQSKRLKLTGIQDMLNASLVKYLIDKIIIKYTLTMLSAYAATGKSLLALVFALVILTGKKLFDTFHVSDTGSVLIIDEENPQAFLKERLQAFGFSADMPLHFLHYQNIKLDNESLFKELCEVIKELKPTLVIIDSLIRVHSQKENEAGMASIMGRLRELVQLGTTVLIIHHHRKGAGDIKEGIRWHSDIIGGVDMALTLEQKDDCLLLSHAKSRTITHAPIKIKLNKSDNGTLCFKWLGDEGAEIIEVISSLLVKSPDGLKQTEILSAIKESGDFDIGEKKIRQVLSRGDGVSWDTHKGGQTGKAIIYTLKNVIRQCGNTIYRETLPHSTSEIPKQPATLDGSKYQQSLDNTKCGNTAEEFRQIAELNLREGVL